MYANANMMRMPTNYVDMNADEIEYEGGWSWEKFRRAAIIGAIVGAGVAAAVFTCGASVGVSIGVASTLIEATALGAISGSMTGSGGYVIDEITGSLGV